MLSTFPSRSVVVAASPDKCAFKEARLDLAKVKLKRYCAVSPTRVGTAHLKDLLIVKGRGIIRLIQLISHLVNGDLDFIEN